MADRSAIEWTDATWNPLRGCSRISPGCTNCYAERMAARGLPGMNSPTTGEPFAIMTPSGPRWTGRVELIESQLEKPLRWRKPRRIFVNSISDTFHRDVPDEWIDRLFAVMALCPQHTFLVLTKRADRMREYFEEAIKPFGERRGSIDDFLYSMSRDEYDALSCEVPIPNVWLGVSVEDQQRADERIPHLLATPAAVRFLSVEPLLGAVDVRRLIYSKWLRRDLGPRWTRTGIDWVIVGGESGPGARPMPTDWARSIRDQCKAAGVAFFMKQIDKKQPIPVDLMIREWPRTNPVQPDPEKTTHEES